ncbi:hypothetical protein C0J52_00230, partial [Blattella germanica]
FYFISFQVVLHWFVYGLVVITSVAGVGRKCEGIGQPLKYLWGDALNDPPDCIGPSGNPYPAATVARTFRSTSGWGSSRTGRSFSPVDPTLTQRTLLENYQLANDAASGIIRSSSRTGRSGLHKYTPRETCSGTPARLCKTRYNTTAPISNECDVVRGECTQTYVPYLFLVIPLGPVTLTGQDYVLVESGCVCKPKYAAAGSSEPSAISAIPQM